MTRLDQYNQPFHVDKLGSEYINYLQRKLKAANGLIDAVERLNPDHLEIGAGYMANMKNLAKKAKL